MDKFEILEAKIARQAEEIEAMKKSIKSLYLRNFLPNSVESGEEESAEILKTLVESDHWPCAVDNNFICDENSEQDKKDRAESILDLIIDVHLEKLKFLDFGCGEGHVVAQSVTQNPSLSIGYDIIESPRWNEWRKDGKGEFTTDWQKIKDNGPYEIILLYDVLDHVEGDDGVVIECLKKIRNVMSPNGRVFVRCHPWCSRHGTHLYHKINKAFVHLVFSEEELKTLGYSGLPTRKIIHPLASYGEWFKSTGFKQNRKEQITKLQVENFFSEVPAVARRVKNQYKNSIEPELRTGKRFPHQLEIQFIDYVLQGSDQ